MRFKPGHKKVGGRKRGVKNKLSVELLARMQEKFPDYCPIEAMCTIAIDENSDPMMRFSAHKEGAAYLYPKRKAVEISGEIEAYVSLGDILARRRK